jgi:hypothetical protein
VVRKHVQSPPGFLSLFLSSQSLPDPNRGNARRGYNGAGRKYSCSK